MKLCIITPYVIKGDGQGRANYEIVQEAVRRGHDVTVLARKVAPELLQNSHIHWVSIAVDRWPTELLREIIFARRSDRWLRQHRAAFDVIQAYGAVTWAKADVNTVQFVHSGWLRSPTHISKVRRDLYGAYQWLYTVLNAHWEKQAFQRAQRVVAVSKRIKTELMTVGVPADRIAVILNGVDVQEFLPSSGDGRCLPSGGHRPVGAHRKQLGLPAEVPLCLFVGDIRTNRKNLDTILKALVYVPQLHLAVVGETQGSPYPNLVQNLKLGHRVHFMGYQLDVAAIMQGVNFFVFPSRYEPFGMVILEAMATGLPVITADTAGAAEIVTSDCGIVLSDPEDTPSLVQALETLTGNRELRSQMGQAGRFIAEQHTWKSKANHYINLFEEIGR